MQVGVTQIKEWERLNAELVVEMRQFSKNYKCRVCDRQPRNAWCEHLLQERTRKFIKRIKEADSLVF